MRFSLSAHNFHNSYRNSIEDLSSKWLPRYRAPSGLGGNREAKSISLEGCEAHLGLDLLLFSIIFGARRILDRCSLLALTS